MQQPRVREAAETAAARAPELLDENGHDLSGLVRSAIWRHCSSVTSKTPLLPPGAKPRWLSGTRAGPVGAGEESRQERALATLWESIEDAAESFQRRFISRRFF